MSGIRFKVLFITLLAINLETVRAALSEDDKQKIIAFLLPHIAECSKDNPITDGAIHTLLESGKFSAINPCFLACIMKRIELLDNSGSMSTEKALELSKEYLSSEDQKNVPELIESCGHINEKDVGDGDKGCERVKMLVECATPFISLFFPTK